MSPGVRRPHVSVPPHPVSRLGTRPALDGLRGLAVTMVVVSHLLPGRFAALGSTGVLVFFVLSGYLITWVLVEDHDRGGRLDLRRFYLRRAARLLPALGSVLVATPLLYAVAGDARLRSAGSEVLAAGLYVMDFVHMQHAVPGLLAPTWSLGVEEQFYLVWPLVLGVVLARWRRRVLPAVAVLLAVALAWTLLMTAIVSQGPDGPAAYWRVEYGPDTQAATLLAGCLLAVVERHRGLPRVGPRWVMAALLGLCVIGFLPVDAVTSLWTHPAVLLLAVVVLAGSGVAVGDLLGRRVPLWVGRRSYGIYLWHFLLVGLVPATLPLAGPARLGGALVGVAVAAVSYRWLEKPVRDRVRARTAAADDLPGALAAPYDDLTRQAASSPGEQPVRRGSSGS